jgi:hypothetical protein
MSVVENVHAVVGKRRPHSDNEHVLSHNSFNNNENNTSDDDIDIIDKCQNTNQTQTHLMSSETESSDRLLESLPPHSEPLSLSQSRDRLRRELKFYFMSPINKWRAKGRLPWKLGLQIIKIVFVTIQLLIFGIDMNNFLTLEANVVSIFHYLFEFKKFFFFIILSII